VKRPLRHSPPFVYDLFRFDSLRLAGLPWLPIISRLDHDGSRADSRDQARPSSCGRFPILPSGKLRLDLSGGHERFSVLHLKNLTSPFPHSPFSFPPSPPFFFSRFFFTDHGEGVLAGSSGCSPFLRSFYVFIDLLLFFSSRGQGAVSKGYGSLWSCRPPRCFFLIRLFPLKRPFGLL